MRSADCRTRLRLPPRLHPRRPQLPFDRRPAFVDAKAGEASCLANLAFLNMNDRVRGRELLLQSAAVLKEAAAAAPDNPRLLWVQGANQWYSTPERGGGQSVALAT